MVDLVARGPFLRNLLNLPVGLFENFLHFLIFFGSRRQRVAVQIAPVTRDRIDRPGSQIVHLAVEAAKRQPINVPLAVELAVGRHHRAVGPFLKEAVFEKKIKGGGNFRAANFFPQSKLNPLGVNPE